MVLLEFEDFQNKENSLSEINALIEINNFRLLPEQKESITNKTLSVA